MKKVILFVGTLAGGGAERAVSNISSNINPHLKKEIVIFGKDSKVDYPYKGEIISLDNLKVDTLPQKINALYKRTKKIKIIKKTNPNATVISFLEYPNLLNSITKTYGKTIVSVRNHMSSKYKKGIKSFLWKFSIKYLYSKTDCIVVVSEEIKKDLIENYGIPNHKIKVIYNSYPINEIQKLSEETLDLEHKKIFDSPTIITAGRLTKQKGHWHLIRAFSETKKSIKDAKLVIMGEGKLQKELEELCEELNIREDVHFIGFQKNPFKFLKRSKAFVMSSLYEGFPNAMAEAMACGLPIISSDCLSGPREILAPKEIELKDIAYNLNFNRYGLLVPNFDQAEGVATSKLTFEEEILKKFMTELLLNEETNLFYSRQSLKRVKDFDIENIIKQWEELV